MESAGINRHGERNEKVLHRRSSDPRWPRPCVGDPQGRSEALDRGTCRPGIEPRNGVVRGADAVMTSGRQHRRGRYRKPPTDPAGSETLCMHGIFVRENREIPRLPSHPKRMRAARRRLRPYARDERSWEVGSPHSTDEAAEQCRGTGGGGGGGKGATQGERDQQIASRTQCRARCVMCAGSRASSRASARPGARPERGAQCGSSARWDLCGGPPERVVPTATVDVREDGGEALTGVRAGRAIEPRNQGIQGADAVN